MELPKLRKPVLERLERLRTQWRTFIALPESRLLHWVFASDELSMLETLLTVEEHGSGTGPDLFLRLTSPLRSPEHYDHALAQELLTRHAALRERLAAAGVESSWQPPRVAPEAAPLSVMALAASIHQHYSPRFRHVALVLMPESMASEKAWAQWVERAVRGPFAAPVRWVCPEPGERSALEQVARGTPRLIHTCVAGLDMATALEEISEAAGDLDTPEGRFRHLFVQMSRALGAGDLRRAEQCRTEAVEMAGARGWRHLQVVAWVALGSGLLSAEGPKAALAEYRQAEAVALLAQEEGDPSGARLLLQSRLAVGSALVASADWKNAASVYEQVAALAAQIGDPLMELEGWRMAAWCHEQAQSWEESWHCGTRALEAAQLMDAPARQNSTLGYAGADLLRLTEQVHFKDKRTELEQQMEHLLGPEWQPTSPGVPQA
ncbi:hypothetical protein [Archangium violaceum]|uniref:MalT-like TPR region domain-containing protein n=1 Tax=Archangium violaceum Cb vi76 TaxID=1406225 RepID=A0A084STY8_9BACT|nr:hypothetical protein [Archangium violaceum]KFA91923.1 hypothetical protein Q664_18710 [Archangium violaceum Cb vi76]